MTKLADEKNLIAAKLIGAPTKSKKKTTGHPEVRTPSKFNKTLSNFAKTTAGYSRFAARWAAKILVATRSRVSAKAIMKLLSDSKNDADVAFAKFMKWLRTPLPAHPEYVSF